MKHLQFHMVPLGFASWKASCLVWPFPPESVRMQRAEMLVLHAVDGRGRQACFLPFLPIQTSHRGARKRGELHASL